MNQRKHHQEAFAALRSLTEDIGQQKVAEENN
jgi:hypothetical protein